MTLKGKEWLAQVVEEPIEPERPLCDPHHHLWDKPDSRYLAEELLADIADNNVVSTVFIERMTEWRQDGPDEMKPIGETEFVQAIADKHADGETKVCAGIVGMADLSLGDSVKPVLEAHLKASPNRFRGVRHATSYDANEEVNNSHVGAPEKLMMDSKFREGVACLREYNLTFDAWLFHPQLPELIDLAKADPDTTIILNHFGGPLGVGTYKGKRAEIFDTWRDSINDLAQCPNVHVKLGGLAMPINGFGWNARPKPPTSTELAEATSAYYLHTIEKFGPDRCMFESNFPVDKMSCPYTVIWNSFKRIASGFSDAEKDLLFHDTAARLYRLQDSATPA